MQAGRHTVGNDSAEIKCIHCGKLCHDEERIWQVRLVDSRGEEYLAPACSNECAQREQMKSANIHKRRLYSVENQSFQVMEVKRYLGIEQ